MVNRIDDFVGWKITDACFDALKTIRRSGGYNTDPFVTRDYQKFTNSSASSRVLLEVESHSTNLAGMGSEQGGRYNVTLELTASAIVKYETGIPRKEAMKLEQDIRTALAQVRDDIRKISGRSCSFTFGRCTHDAGLLAPGKEAGFSLSFSFSYSQGSEW